MKNKLTQNTVRSLSRTAGRFISILAIIAIGCAFFSGIKSCSRYMKNSSYEYLKNLGAADIRLRSTLGFSEDDVEAVRNTEGVGNVYAGYSSDLFIDRGTENIIVSVYSYNSKSDINKLSLTEGRLPENENECVADYQPYRCDKFGIGDKITLMPDSDTEISDILKNNEYTVVGLVRSPVYVAQERGSTSLGNGVVNGYIYIPEECFAGEAYTDMFISCEGAADINCFTDKYEKAVSEVTDRLETLSDKQISSRSDELQAEFDEETADAEKELDNAEKEYTSGKEDYEKGLAKIESACEEIDEQQKTLDESKKELDNGLDDFLETQESLRALISACAEVDSMINEYSESFVLTLPEELVDRLKSVQDAYDKFEVGVNIRDMLALYIITDPAVDNFGKTEMRRNISSTNEQVRSKTGQIAIEIQNQSDILNESEKQLADAQKQIDEARAEIDDSAAELYEGKEELDKARHDIDEGRQELEDSAADFNTLLEGGKWYVWGRDDAFPYYSSYSDDTERVDSIAAVFPLFFILIAALVCICTMTRMIEEKRTETGTFKALGFSASSISFQYVMYAAAASFIGSTAGVAAGLKVIPVIIYTAYCSMYNFPYIRTEFNWVYYLGCLGVSLICTAVSAAYACRKNLYDNPAQLMRPKPPKSGKRIFLEKIPFIWKHLSFSFKVSFRNLLRYKSRFFMSVLGVAGCTALLLAGFSLKNSISVIVDRQFGQLFTYDAAVVLNTDASEEKLSEAKAAAEDCTSAEEHMGAYIVSKDISCGDTTVKDITVTVPDDINGFGSFIDLHERTTGMRLFIPEDGAVITEKLSELLDVGVGDEITVEDGLIPVKVSGIAENYVNNYVYISRSLCSELFEESTDNTVMLKLNDGYDADAVSEELLKYDGILAVTYTADGGNKFSELIESMDLVVGLIIVFSGALAFVVLFNLAVINVNERVHELATLKVLGFFDGEVSSYIYRENIFSVILGIIPGLGLGVALLKFVLVYAEVDSVMFARDIPGYCFAVAALVTALFAAFVNIVIHFRLKKIDMAASLKAIE